MNCPTMDLNEYIASQLTDFTEGVNLFIAEMPENIDEGVVAWLYGGGSQNPRYAEDSFDIQYTSKSKTYSAGYNLLQSIRQLLEGATDLDLNGCRYIHMIAKSGILSLGVEEGAYMFSISFRGKRAVPVENAGNRVKV